MSTIAVADTPHHLDPVDLAAIDYHGHRGWHRVTTDPHLPEHVTAALRVEHGLDLYHYARGTVTITLGLTSDEQVIDHYGRAGYINGTRTDPAGVLHELASPCGRDRTLGRLLDEASDSEADVLVELARRARLLWHCDCDWHNARTTVTCDGCGTLDPNDRGPST